MSLDSDIIGDSSIVQLESDVIGDSSAVWLEPDVIGNSSWSLLSVGRGMEMLLSILICGLLWSFIRGASL